ncbi:diacylglycerol kinase [Jiella pelagia]|uniref:Diacylglycerol kinase n=1 Tax=Jiella pelagia TaxID=2986949 RepID=A0ABY7C2W9_9HYPH|nr:diacylglycerol kinase [Jiella pelagia]WAP69379.1 diacylglycerol kinase [Jiella pelagia]
MEHVIAATGYSAAGLRVLLREQAFRHELVVGGLIIATHLAIGVSALFIAGQFLIIAMLLAAEALNTAIEKIVDRLSPERSAFARDAKDLGSAAVFFIIIANAIFAILAWLSNVA